MLASMLGFIISQLLFLFLLIAIVAAIVSKGSDQKKEISENSVLKIELNEEIADRSSKNPLESFDISSLKANNQLGLNDILEDVKKAKSDENIKGIYLELSNIQCGMASLEEIRNALIDFKSSKKFIYSYSEYYTQKGYYLASIADSVFLHPAGEMDWKGMSAQLMFFKGALEKLEVEPEIIRHGKFKSAIEPFILDKMSDANRLQTRSFVGSIWNHIVQEISKSRKISIAQLNELASSLAISSSEDALKKKMVDRLCYYDEVSKLLIQKSGSKSDKEISFIKLNKYHDVPEEKNQSLSMDKIAVIYAEGEIESGEGGQKKIGSTTIADAIRQARKDKKVKAIVLRVNSPGGSALASDVIWRETILAKKEKPIVVSMGDVAASGGYYISCAANKIFAEPTTITGSIGVFGLMFNAQKLLNNKLGITIDTVNTNAHADFGSTFRAMSPDEKQVLQKSVEKVYGDFISKVASGRGKTTAEIDSIGQGRVWAAVDAIRIGLVDELGGLDKAIEEAAKLAKLKEYRISNLPKQKDAFEQIVEDLSGNTEAAIKAKMGYSYKYVEIMRTLEKANHTIQARMEFEPIIY